MEFIIELFTFLKARKKLWFFPIIVLMVAIGGLIVISEGSVLAPLIYTLF